MDFTKDIYINKDVIYENQEIVLLYKGFLFNNNLANDIYISYGYGDMWENQSEIKMKPSTFGYLATIKIENSPELQFCFRDSNGNWDNNNSGNYILPIEKDEEVLSFKTLQDTTKEVSFEIFGDEEEQKNNNNNNEEIFETSVISSDNVELYNTSSLSNTDKKAIPNDTIITQVNLENENANSFQEAVIKQEKSVEATVEAFNELTKQISTSQAFDEGKVSTGSLYVNSIVKDISDDKQVEENNDKKSLIEAPVVSPMEKINSFFDVLFKNVKTAVAKIVKLVKISLNFNEDEDKD